MLRLDDLQNGYRIYQDPKLFCFGIDAVLLAHYPNLRDGDRILDLCSGFAPIPFMMLSDAKKRGFKVSIDALEIQSYVAETAQKSVEENGVGDCIKIINGDIKETERLFPAASFSLITCNPPYMPANSGIIGNSEAKAIARTEILCTLDDVCKSAARLLKPKGRFAMIHRPTRLPEILETLRKYRIEPKRIRFIHPYEQEEATMVLIESVRGGNAYMMVESPLIIYDQPQVYTDEVMKIYGRTQSKE